MQDQSSIMDQLKGHGLNLAQVIILFSLLIMPQEVGSYLIIQLGLTEVNHYLDSFLIMAGVVVIYYIAIMAMHNRLITRIHDLVYLKYLVVIAVCFWVLADGYLAYIFQQVFVDNQDRISRRDIVWRDVAFEDLPSNVIYPNFHAAYMFILLSIRCLTVAILAYSLMTEKKQPVLRKKRSRVRRNDRQEKSIEELKATVHPSVLKRYKKQQEEDK